MNYKRLSASDVTLARQLVNVFAAAFEDKDSYNNEMMSDEYIASLLSSQTTIILVAISEEESDPLVVGGLVAYELPKFGQEKSEIYIYDLAVAEKYRRQGIATGLIENLKPIAKDKGAEVIFVQADNVDNPAVALYTKLASQIETEVTHFDISVK